MANVAILVPYVGMRDLAESLARDCPNVNLMSVEYVHRAQVAGRVKELEEAGCDLIVARGVHAGIARESVQLPVVEIRVATPELGFTILELKEELGGESPQLGLIGFANMFYDTQCFNSLLGVELKTYMVKGSEEMPAAVEQAVKDGCQGVIGGDTVCDSARHRGIPCRFLSSGEESLRITMDTVSRVCYAIDLEKRNSAEMDVMLDNTFSGIVRIGPDGKIQRVNRTGYNLLERSPAETIGRPVTEVLPSLDRRALQEALSVGQETYAMAMAIHQRAVAANLVPVLIEGKIEGALLTFQEGNRIREMDNKLRWELYQRGYIAKYTFDRLVHESPRSVRNVELARRMAKYSSPILLVGERGVGKGIFAQCLHNESLFHHNAFVPLDCSAWQPETLDTMLFGNYTSRKDSLACMAELAKDGTLYLSHVEALPMELQYKVMNLIRGKFLHNGPNQPSGISVRVIASTDVNLVSRVERGEFRSDLYYALSVLTLELLPLRQNREDIPGWLDFYLGEWQEEYQHYAHLTQGAKKFLQEYDWPGNLDQMNSLCGRIVLLAEKRSIDETFLRRQLEQMTPKLLPGTGTVVVYRDRKAAELAELFRKHNGNREKVAAELGVSKTTLWRYVKKYGLEDEQ
ncbi:MAG: sigma 54-interacting transcriptional regulator [Oscillospiraceae bacterium]|nr:sigma 54-interacting transcriptional regulator [Oscillospiraceae bacterium]